MGSIDDYLDFNGFINQISGSEVTVKGTNIEYDSPSLGKMIFGWTGPFLVNEKTISLKREMKI